MIFTGVPMRSTISTPRARTLFMAHSSPAFPSFCSFLDNFPPSMPERYREIMQDDQAVATVPADRFYVLADLVEDIPNVF